MGLGTLKQKVPKEVPRTVATGTEPEAWGSWLHPRPSGVLTAYLGPIVVHIPDSGSLRTNSTVRGGRGQTGPSGLCW